VFGMSPALTGGIIGLAFGVFSYYALSPPLIRWIERSARENGEEPVKGLWAARWFDLVIYPAIGYAIGYYAF
jgi:hypothetical protein